MGTGRRRFERSVVRGLNLESSRSRCSNNGDDSCVGSCGEGGLAGPGCYVMNSDDLFVACGNSVLNYFRSFSKGYVITGVHGDGLGSVVGRGGSGINECRFYSGYGSGVTVLGVSWRVGGGGVVGCRLSINFGKGGSALLGVVGSSGGMNSICAKNLDKGVCNKHFRCRSSCRGVGRGVRVYRGRKVALSVALGDPDKIPRGDSGV